MTSFDPLIFYTEGVFEINVKDIGGSLEETIRRDGNIQLTENEFLRYQSRMIECVDAVTIRDTREISEGLDTDQDCTEDVRPRQGRGHIWTIIKVKWFNRKPSGDDFYCVFSSVEQTFFLELCCCLRC